MKRHHRRRGSSLIEILVSCLILSIALISFAQLFLAGYVTKAKARYISLATSRAQDEIARLHSIEYDDLLNGPIAADFPTSAEGGVYQHVIGSDARAVRFTVDDLPNGQGELSWKPSSLAGKSDTNLLNVVSRITWDNPGQRQVSVVISTLIANQ